MKIKVNKEIYDNKEKMKTTTDFCAKSHVLNGMYK